MEREQPFDRHRGSCQAVEAPRLRIPGADITAFEAVLENRVARRRLIGAVGQVLGQGPLGVVEEAGKRGIVPAHQSFGIEFPFVQDVREPPGIVLGTRKEVRAQ